MTTKVCGEVDTEVTLTSCLKRINHNAITYKNKTVTTMTKAHHFRKDSSSERCLWKRSKRLPTTFAPLGTADKQRSSGRREATRAPIQAVYAAVKDQQTLFTVTSSTAVWSGTRSSRVAPTTVTARFRTL